MVIMNPGNRTKRGGSLGVLFSGFGGFFCKRTVAFAYNCIIENVHKQYCNKLLIKVTTTVVVSFITVIVK